MKSKCDPHVTRTDLRKEQRWPQSDLQTDLHEDGSLDQQGSQPHHDPIAEVVYGEVEGEVTQGAYDDVWDVDGDDNMGC